MLSLRAKEKKKKAPASTADVKWTLMNAQNDAEELANCMNGKWGRFKAVAEDQKLWQKLGPEKTRHAGPVNGSSSQSPGAKTAGKR